MRTHINYRFHGGVTHLTSPETGADVAQIQGAEGGFMLTFSGELEGIPGRKFKKHSAAEYAALAEFIEKEE